MLLNNSKTFKRLLELQTGSPLFKNHPSVVIFRGKPLLLHVHRRCPQWRNKDPVPYATRTMTTLKQASLVCKWTAVDTTFVVAACSITAFLQYKNTKNCPSRAPLPPATTLFQLNNCTIFSAPNRMNLSFALASHGSSINNVCRCKLILLSCHA